MKYSVSKKEDFFIRQEREGTFVFVYKKTMQQFLLNQTGFKIIEFILQSCDTQDVFDKLQNEYTQVNKELLAKDFKDICGLLKVYGIIKEKRCEKVGLEKSEYLNAERVDVSAVGDNDYNKLSSFIWSTIKEAGNQYSIVPIQQQEYYEPINLRSRVINNSEYYLQAVNCDGEVVSVMSIVPNFENSVVLINTFFISRNFEVKEILRIIEKFNKYIVRIMIKPVNKIRIIFSCEDISEFLTSIKLFEQSGFVKECELKKEIGEKSLFMYTKFLIK